MFMERQCEIEGRNTRAESRPLAAIHEFRPTVPRPEVAVPRKRTASARKPFALVESNPPLPANEIRSYEDLLAVLRARADSLQISLSTIDSIAGFSEYYAAHVMALRQHKRLGMMSLGPMLGALSLRLVAVACDESFARNRSRYVRRDEAHYRAARKGHDANTRPCKPRTRQPGRRFAKISGIATATFGGAVHYAAPMRFEKLSGAITARLLETEP
jgi:hypothetical protein